LKGYLQQKKVAFRAIDVTQDPAAIEEIEKLAGQRVVPVTKIGNDVVVGFDRAKLDKLLAATT
jgi:glutaredoxin